MHAHPGIIMEICIEKIYFIGFCRYIFKMIFKACKIPTICTLNSCLQLDEAHLFSYFLKFAEMQPAKANPCYNYVLYLSLSEASAVLCIWFRIYAPPPVLLCCVGLVLLEHLVTEPNTAPTNYCQNCNGMHLRCRARNI